MINKDPVKTLEKFKKEYEKLLAKYPEIFVHGDIDGDVRASIGKERKYLPACANEIVK